MKKLIKLSLILILAVCMFTCAGSLKITATPETGDAPLTVKFTPSGLAKGTVSMDYFWYFGTGSFYDSSNEKEPTFTFEEPGTYTVELDLLRNYRNYSDQHTETIKIVVTEPDPIDSTPSVSIAADPTSGVADLLVQFSSSITGGNAPLTYSWTFGDTGTSTEVNPSHTYTSAGEYTATLTVTDSDGDSDSDDVEITVTELAGDLEVTITMDPVGDAACGEVVTDFDSTVTGGQSPYTYLWDFDNSGDSSTQADPQDYCCFYAYKTYNVTVTVTDNSATEVTSDPITFTCVDPE